MKIYRQSVWKERDRRIYFVLGVFFGIPLLIGLVNPYALLSAFLFSGLVSCIFFLVSAVGYFYLQTYNKGIGIKNSFYLFWNKSYRYPDISMAEFGYLFNVRSQCIYLRIHTSEGKSWKYAINLVSDEDVLQLIEELKSHVVKISTTQAFAGYYAAIERRKHEKAQGEALRLKAKAYEEQMHQERERMKRNLIK